MRLFVIAEHVRPHNALYFRVEMRKKFERQSRNQSKKRIS